METLYSLPFAVLECPNIKLKKPSWLHMPSPMTVYAVVIVSYFLITGGKGSACAKLTVQLAVGDDGISQHMTLSPHYFM